MKDKAIVDIDGILWSLGPVWHRELVKINPDCPFPGENGDWYFYSDYMSDEEARAAVKAVHMEQDKYRAFPGAHYLTDAIRRTGTRVVIASHRDVDSRDATVKWLNKHNIYFDELYVGPNKHHYFEDGSVRLVIDDAPKTQELAVDMGIPVFSIRYPYNKHMEGVIFYTDFGALVSGINLWANSQLGIVSSSKGFARLSQA